MTTRLFHISDLHFGIDDPNALAAVADAVKAERPDVVVCTGDTTQRAKHSEYKAAAEWLASLEVPVTLDPGNHDMPYYDLWQRFTDPYARFRGLHRKVAGSFESDDVVLIPLVSTVRAQPRFPWSDGFVRKRPLARTIARLDALKDDERTKIVTCHHPLLGPEGAENPTIGGDEAFFRVAEAGADVILSGHVHFPFDDIRSHKGQSMRMIGAGTLSKRLRHGAPPSYRVILCDRGGKMQSEVRVVG